MQITVDEVTFDGMAVTAIGEKDIALVSKAKLNYLAIDSCARENVVQNVDSGWFGGVGKTYSYHFAPTRYETEYPCPLYIQAVSADGITAWGYLFWRTDEHLPAVFDCNGHHRPFSGVSICQTKTGIRQEIFFDREVQHVESQNCEVSMDVKTKNAYVIATHGNGFCYATFTDGKELHRVVLLGYDQVIVRDP